MILSLNFIFFVVLLWIPMGKNKDEINDKKINNQENVIESSNKKENNDKESQDNKNDDLILNFDINDKIKNNNFLDNDNEEIINIKEKLLNEIKKDILLFKELQENNYTSYLNKLKDINGFKFSFKSLITLYIKALRLSPEMIRIKNEILNNKYKLLNLIEPLKIQYGFNLTKTILSKNLGNQNKYDQSQNFNIDLNILPLIKNILNILYEPYIQFQWISLEEMELSNKIFSQLVNNITEAMNNQLKIIKFFIYCVFCLQEIKYNLEYNKENLEEYLDKLQMFTKYMDQLLQTYEQLQDNLMKIENLTGESFDQLLWDNMIKDHPMLQGFLDDEILKNEIKTLQSIIEIKDLNQQKNSIMKFFYKSLNKNYGNFLPNDKFIQFTNKIIMRFGLNKYNLEELTNKKKIFNRVLEVFNLFNINKSYTIQWIKEQEKTKKHDWSFSIGLKNITNVILNVINGSADAKNKIHQIQNKGMNFFIQLKNLINKLESYQRQSQYLSNKEKIINLQLEQYKKKLAIIVSVKKYENLQLKYMLLKFIDEAIENNNIERINLLLSHQIKQWSVKK